MILNSKPENEAILSNVGEIGEFRIRNSAKAFSILSSGLYANKIRAVVRELSCNAVDSHAAAGSADVPFEVHMPTMLEPWFSVRDYGVGLNHDQVTQIYTTYFESTKTLSNEFIGALGLGSKSPFSYTDNFTVTAIQNGRQGIYTAFINADGVPSIALMQAGETDQPTGVEVKFSVNDRNDFSKFRAEAAYVYKWFAVKPTVLGMSGFQHEVQVYDIENLVPGVHTVPTSRVYGTNITSYAVMGNIAYPVDVPNAVENLGDLSSLLQCGLVIHFGIGDLDFQASREGLSYIPQTIASIRTKLLAVRDVLTVRLTADADAIGNQWQRAQWLNSQFEKPLWKAAVAEYVRNTGFGLFDPGKRYDRCRIFELREDQLKESFNIEIRMFGCNSYGKCSPRTPDRGVQEIPGDTPGYHTFWSVPVASQTLFVIGDIKTGALTRATYHWRQRNTSDNVYVLTPADKTQPMKTSHFMAAICGPPDEQIHLASELDQPERQARASNAGVTIMVLTQRTNGRYGRKADKTMVWRATYSLDQFNTTDKVLYVPLVGFEVQSQHSVTDIKLLHTELIESCLFGNNLVIHGVRKQDLAQVQALSNWVNLEDHIVHQLSSMDEATIQGMALNQVDSAKEIVYNKHVLQYIADDTNLLKLLIQKLTPVQNKHFNHGLLESLSRRFAPGSADKVNNQIRQLTSEVAAVNQRYPLLKHLAYANGEHVAEYINLIHNKN